MKTKQIGIIMLAVLGMLLAGCVNEKNFDGKDLDKSEVGFRIAGVQETKSDVDLSERGINVAAGKAGDDLALYLEEIVSSLDDINCEPVTKGTPALTANVKDLYGSFKAVALKSDGTEGLPEATFKENEGVWSHYYGGNIWENAPLTYFMRMPESQSGVTSGYTYSVSDQKMSFAYKTPETATTQQDILFSSAIVEDQENNKEITFYHALTGVKFANFFSNSSENSSYSKTIIKSATISGLVNSGTCTMDLTESTSRSSVRADWTLGEEKSDYSQTYDEAFADYSQSSYNLSGEGGINATASIRNLNDKDASLTFWFIPQTLSDDVMIKVVFDVVIVDGTTSTKTFENQELEISLGAALKDEHKTWKAGQLHTFTLKPVVVGVDIDDELTEYEKKDVVIVNEGNVYEYVRVNLVGNWVGQLYKSGGDDNPVYEDDKTILFGYKYSDKDADGNYLTSIMVEAWNDKDGRTSYGTFDELCPKSTVVPASEANTVNNWVRYDKYYYYIKPIGPSQSVTDQLFKSYTVGVSPEFWIADKWGVRHKAGNVHLEMDLAVQAIPAPVDNDGNVIDNDDNQGYIRAWVNALGLDSKDDLLDL